MPTAATKRALARKRTIARKRKRCPLSHMRTKPAKGRGLRMCSCGRGWIRVAAPDKRVLSKHPPCRRPQRKNPVANLSRYQCGWCRSVVTNVRHLPPTLLTVQRPNRVAKTFKICPDCVEFWSDDNGFSILTRR